MRRYINSMAHPHKVHQAGPLSLLILAAMSWLPVVAADAGKPSLSELIDLNKVVLVTEVETNNTAATANDIQSWLEPEEGRNSALISGELSTPQDIDCYQVLVPSGQDLIVGFNLTGSNYQGFTGLTAGTGQDIFFSADGRTLWKLTGNGAVLMASQAKLAQGAGLATQQIVISDLSATPDQRVLLTLAGRGDVLLVDQNGMVSRVITDAQVRALTGQTSADLQEVEVAPNGSIYFLDAVSGTVLKTGVLLGLSIYFNLSDLAIVTAEDVLAANVWQFNPTSLLAVSGHSLWPDGYYVTQFSRAGLISQGDGSIAYFVPNPGDPGSSGYYRIYDPLTSPDKITHPAALALATATNTGFEQGLFAGTMGADNGDRFDGGIYRVETGNRLTPFVSRFVDRLGQQVMRDGAAVDGFYDVYDLAFSGGEGTPYGNYLYAISENIDSNGAEPGGHQSDLWRIDSFGTAYLFAEKIMNGAGSILFDTGGLYQNGLYLASWTAGSQIMRVYPNGSAELWLTLDDRYAIMDMALIPPGGGALAGQIVLTLAEGFYRHLAVLDPQKNITLWLSHIPAGSFPAGDIVFNAGTELIMTGNESRSLVRLNFQAQLTDTPLALRVHPGTSSPTLLVGNGAGARLIDLGLNGQANEAYTAVMPDFIQGDARGNTPYTFDTQDNLYLYDHQAGVVRKGTRNAGSGLYDYFEVAVTAAQLAGTDGQPRRVTALIWQTAGLTGLLTDPASNQTELATLTLAADQQAPTLLNADALNQMEIRVTGPSGYDVALSQDGMGLMLNESMGQYLEGELPPGVYSIQIQALNETAGPYELLIGPEGVRSELTLTALNSPLLLETVDGQRLAFAFLGRGQARVSMTMNPLTGRIIAIDTIHLTETRSGTAFSLTNIDQPGNLRINQVILDSPLTNLTCEGRLEAFTSNAAKAFSATSISLGRVRQVNAPACRVTQFSAVALGDGAATELLPFILEGVRDVNVYGDVASVRFFDSRRSIALNSLAISGVMHDSILYARSVGELTLFNQNQTGLGLTRSRLDINGALGSLLLYSGALQDSVLLTSGSIGILTVNNGDLRNCEISCTRSRSSGIGGLWVLGAPAGRGNIANCLIYAGKSIGKVYAEGNIDSITRLYAGSSLSSSNQIKEVTTGGDLAAVVSAPKIDTIRCGFDRNGKRRAEGNSYQGGQFSGSVTSVFSITEVNITGAILPPATVTTTGGSIGRVYTEDGFNGTLQANGTVSKLMVGFIAGNPKTIANPNADVAGAVMAYKLGQLYYTGAQILPMTLPPRQGTVKQISK